MIKATKIRRIGNSLGIILPAEAVNALSLVEGDVLVLTRQGDSLAMRVVTPTVEGNLEAYSRSVQRYSTVFRELAHE